MLTYKICLALLAKGTLTMEYLDAYMAAGRITAEQYKELAARVKAQ